MRTIPFYDWAAGIPEAPEPPRQLATGHRPDPGRLVASLDALGLPDALPEVRTAHDRIAALSAALRAGAGRLDAGRPDVIARLASGAVELPAALAELGELERGADPRGPAGELTGKAQAACREQIHRALRERGEQLVDDLRPAVAAIVDESLTLAGKLPAAVTDDRSAAGAGGKAADAWGRLGELHRLWTVAHDLADELRGCGYLDHADGDLGEFDTTGVKEADMVPDVHRLRGQFLPSEYRWRTPPPRGGGGPVQLQLARGQAEDRGPGIYTAAEVREHRAERARASERTPAGAVR